MTYVAPGRPGTLYTPSALVTVSRDRFPVTVAITTFAPTTAAPELSTTVPVIYPVSCARLAMGRSRQRAMRIAAAQSCSRRTCVKHFEGISLAFTMKPPGNFSEHVDNSSLRKPLDNAIPVVQQRENDRAAGKLAASRSLRDPRRFA